ncbi:beta-glucosidase [Cephaloticoccus primus]|uniref:beta-glucosidase n=1 Tax=Cephaloticoccus primus TaxID=1548207 RepID=A0A139SJM3_9BACT|nr:glycoside hydrolase family 3 N-terminal domain-containing protein [Cephaloticoccus primus]KXU34741.1 beta-glucosidase [Cephaloticoccus primus]
MTLEEKVGQLNTASRSGLQGEEPLDIASLRSKYPAAERTFTWLKDGLIGSFYGGGGVASALQLQRIAVEETRLGIPLLFAADVLHGSRTIWPIPLGEASSFEPELARRTARATAVEATATGIHWNYSPMVDLARDQRWGRVVEGSGEDPVLGSAFAAARVRGFQGDDIRAPDSQIATMKHFAGYGASMGGRDYAQVDISLEALRDLHFPPHKGGVDAGALSVMSAFNSLNGIPATGSRLLLNDVLRDEWGFQGVIVSDWNSVAKMVMHGYAADDEDAVRKAILAGLDVALRGNAYVEHLPALVRSGQVPESVVDNAVRRVLTLKEKIGLFDNPYRSLDPDREADFLDPKRPAYAALIASQDALSREAGRRSIVLLKNEGSLLPLRKSGQRIALIGPFAQDIENIAGPWASGVESRFVTLEAGVRAAVRDQSLLEIVTGSDIESPIEGGIEAAVAAARRADVVVLAVGEHKFHSGEGQSRVELTVPAPQQALVEAVAATGKPVVILLRNGRALALEGAVRDAQAIVVTWFLGTQNGHSIADVLFGDYNPSGKLPVSFPQHSGQQPFFYNHLPTGQHVGGSRWREYPNAPLYAFGHGLSYTTFGYGTPRLSKEKLGWDEELQITTTITNTGKVFGEEVVQLYIRDRVASRVRPVRELKKFTKIGLQPGESQQVSFGLSRHDLEFTTQNGDYTAEPGLFDLWVSSASDTGEPVQFELLAPSKR